MKQRSELKARGDFAARVNPAVPRRRFLTGLAGAGALLAAPRLGRAETIYPLLQGRTVTILVGSEVGGNFDLFARSIARHFERQIPGFRVEVKNVPQASGALAAKLVQEGPSDGTMLITSSSGLLSAQVQGEESVAYDLSSWGWLGKLATETRTLVLGRGADFRSFEELQAKTTPSSMSVRSKTSFAYHEALWLNAILGLRIKPVPGYKASEKESALVQGEVMLTVVGFPTDRDVLDSPGVDVMMRMTDGPTLPERFRSRPFLHDLVADKPSALPIAEFMRVSTTTQNWMAAPPGTPPDLLAEYRRAFESAATEPQYLEEAGKLGFAVALTPGAALSEQIGAIFADADSLRGKLASAYECGLALAEGVGGPCQQS